MSASIETARKAQEAELNEQICAAVREMRLQLGVLQAQVAEHVGLAHSSYSRYESGQRMLSAAMLYQIATFFRQPVTAFLPGSSSNAPSSTLVKPDIAEVVRVLETRPDLIPTVQGLLSTMLDQEEYES